MKSNTKTDFTIRLKLSYLTKIREFLFLVLVAIGLKMSTDENEPK